MKQDILTVPISAIKSSANSSYIEMFDVAMDKNAGNQGVTSSTLPREQMVEVGISNDTLIEIISGLKEGDQVISRTITASTAAKTTAQTAPSLFGGGGNRAATGGVRIPRW